MRTSIHTRLRFFSSYLLLTLSSPFPSSLLQLTHSPPCRRNRPLLLECLRMLPNKVCTSTLSFWIDGTRDLSCVLVRWPWFHSPSCYNIYDRAFLVLRSFPIPVPCTVQFFFSLFFCCLWLGGVPFVPLTCPGSSIFLPCVSLSSSADPNFFVQC